MRTQKASIKKNIVALIIIVIVFIGAFSFLAVIVEHSVKADKKQLLSQVTASGRDNMQRMFDGYFASLNVMAKAIMFSDVPESRDNALLIKKLSEDTDFKGIGVYLLSNVEYSTDSQVYTSDNREYFTRSLAGKNVISPSLIDDIDGKPINILSVPLYHNKMVAGVLYGKISTSTIEQVFSGIGAKAGTQLYLMDAGMRTFGSEQSPSPAEIFAELSDEQRVQVAGAMSRVEFEPYVVFSDDTALCYASVGSNGIIMLVTMQSDSIVQGSRNITLLALLLLLSTSVVFIALLWHSKVTFNKSRQKANATSKELETVISGIPGGVVRFTYGANLAIQFLNEGLLAISGYSRNELHLLLANSFANFLHYDDRAKIEKVIMQQKDDGQPLEATCRLLNKSGTYSWFLIRGKQVEDGEGQTSCLCVLTDITTMKRTERELSQTMQRYAIVISQSDSIIYEYNFNDETIYLSNRWSEKFNFPANTPMFFDRAISSGFVHYEDAGKVTSLFARIKRGMAYDFVEIRLLDINDQYIWCRLKASAIFDEDGKVYKTVGKFLDIDDSYRQTENLKQMAEIDSLTGIYNKGAVSSLIGKILDSSSYTEKHALLVLDIDNFKSINDTVGHSAGDEALKCLSDKIKTQLRKSDIFGRIGGDEFVVLLKNVHSTQEIKQRANELCDSFSDKICFDGKTVEVSCSIGIAVRSETVNDFSTLFEKADVALYESKRNGKNQITVYGEW